MEDNYYIIYDNGVEINTLVGDYDFISAYCAENGYTFEYVAPEAPPPEPTMADELNELKGAVDILLEGILNDENRISERSR